MLCTSFTDKEAHLLGLSELFLPLAPLLGFISMLNSCPFQVDENIIGMQEDLIVLFLSPPTRLYSRKENIH